MSALTFLTLFPHVQHCPPHIYFLISCIYTRTYICVSLFMNKYMFACPHNLHSHAFYLLVSPNLPSVINYLHIFAGPPSGWLDEGIEIAPADRLDLPLTTFCSSVDRTLKTSKSRLSDGCIIIVFMVGGREIQNTDSWIF